MEHLVFVHDNKGGLPFLMLRNDGGVWQVAKFERDGSGLISGLRAADGSAASSRCFAYGIGTSALQTRATGASTSTSRRHAWCMSAAEASAKSATATTRARVPGSSAAAFP